MIQKFKEGLLAELKVYNNQIDFYKNKINDLTKDEDIKVLKISVSRLEEYLLKRELTKSNISEIEKLEKIEQEEFELALSEAPYIYERPIPVQI